MGHFFGKSLIFAKMGTKMGHFFGKIPNICKNGCKNGSSNQNSVQHKEILQPLSKKCIWGPKCTPKAHLCAQIVIQEADILRARRQYQMAAQVGIHNIAY